MRTLTQIKFQSPFVNCKLQTQHPNQQPLREWFQTHFCNPQKSVKGQDEAANVWIFDAHSGVDPQPRHSWAIHFFKWTKWVLQPRTVEAVLLWIGWFPSSPANISVVNLFVLSKESIFTLYIEIIQQNYVIRMLIRASAGYLRHHTIDQPVGGNSRSWLVLDLNLAPTQDFLAEREQR